MAENQFTFESAIGTAAPSTEHLVAWPTLTQAAVLLKRSLPAVSRVVDARGIPKHRLGGRSRKLAPVVVLDLAIHYGVDVAATADGLMTIAEQSGAPARFIKTTEDDIGAWFAGQARQVPQPSGDQLQALVDAVHDVADDDVATAILRRAGLIGSDAVESSSSPALPRR